MTNAELVAILSPLASAQTNPIGVYSVRAKEGASLPYLVVVYGTTDNFEADNKVYSKEQGVSLELYTESKDEVSEGLVENLLDTNSIPWDKDEAFDDGEQFYINYYSITRR